MKSKAILITSLFLSYSSFSQTNTYPWPQNDNIGIGVTPPTQKLDVNGGIKGRGGIESQGSLAGNHAFYSNFNDGTFTNWLGTTSDPPAINLLGSSNHHAGFGVVDGDGIHSPIIWMYNYGENALRIRSMDFLGDMTSGNDLMIVKQNGRVGIGTIDPQKKFHLFNGEMLVDNTTDGYLAQFRSTTTGWTEINVENLSGAGGSAVSAHIKVEGGQVEIGSRSAHPVHIGAGDNNSHLNILTNGNVGVGTINPQAKLAVSGKILCEEIEVVFDVPASDYVFEEDYNLLSLEEVNDFIQKNKHLPEVPSAEEFKKGYKVGEMDDLLLRKVEELTLYIIQLKKEMDELKKDN